MKQNLSSSRSVFVLIPLLTLSMGRISPAQTNELRAVMDYEDAKSCSMTARQLAPNSEVYRQQAKYVAALAAYKSAEYGKAFGLFMPFAKEGDSRAQYYVGSMYDWARGVMENHEEAAKWYRKSADQDDGEAQFWLAMRYYSGLGIAQSYDEAAKWFEKSARHGGREAQWWMGALCEFGQGVKQDTEEAIRWYKKAAAQGQEEAKKALARLGISIVTPAPPLAPTVVRSNNQEDFRSLSYDQLLARLPQTQAQVDNFNGDLAQYMSVLLTKSPTWIRSSDTGSYGNSIELYFDDKSIKYVDIKTFTHKYGTKQNIINENIMNYRRLKYIRVLTRPDTAISSKEIYWIWIVTDGEGVQKSQRGSPEYDGVGSVMTIYVPCEREQANSIARCLLKIAKDRGAKADVKFELLAGS